MQKLALLNCILKIFSFISLDWISAVINTDLRREQNGFRPNRSWVDHINTIRIIVEHYGAHCKIVGTRKDNRTYKGHIQRRKPYRAV